MNSQKLTAMRWSTIISLHINKTSKEDGFGASLTKTKSIDPLKKTKMLKKITLKSRTTAFYQVPRKLIQNVAHFVADPVIPLSGARSKMIERLI